MMGGFLAKAESVDPTKPVAYHSDGGEESSEDAVSAKKTLQLTSILVSEDRKVAVIDGEIKNEGDNVGPYKVVEIREYQVDLKNDMETKTLEIGKSILKSIKPEEKG